MRKVCFLLLIFILIGLILTPSVFGQVTCGGTCSCVGKKWGENPDNNCTTNGSPPDNLRCKPAPAVCSGQNEPCVCQLGCVDPVGKTPTDETLTAVGCIPHAPKELIRWVLGKVIGLGGGVAFLLMIFGGFQVITSSGSPEGTKKGTDMITTAVSGLVFIIFSVFLLELIGVDILHIPSFSTTP